MSSASGIIGHASQVSSLDTDLKAGNVAHAYLFAGKKHLGKFTIARWFARTLLLNDATEEAERARLSHEIDRLIHRDLLVIDRLWVEDVCEDFDMIAKTSNVPQQHRAKAGAKTDTISIEDIRALQERLLEVATGRYRCCLIRSVERLQEEAVNALLKILEEPPEGVVFLLTTESFSQLLPTLISRSRVLRFFPLPTTELVPLLHETSEEDVQFLLKLAQGSPGVILRLTADPDAMRNERLQYSSAVSFWHSPTLGERMKLLEPLLERGESCDRFLLHLALALREEKSAVPERSKALGALVADLHTNASRPLLLQRFVLSTAQPSLA